MMRYPLVAEHLLFQKVVSKKHALVTMLCDKESKAGSSSGESIFWFIVILLAIVIILISPRINYLALQRGTFGTQGMLFQRMRRAVRDY